MEVWVLQWFIQEDGRFGYFILYMKMSVYLLYIEVSMLDLDGY